MGCGCTHARPKARAKNVPYRGRSSARSDWRRVGHLNSHALRYDLPRGGYVLVYVMWPTAQLGRMGTHHLEVYDKKGKMTRCQLADWPTDVESVLRELE